MSDIPDKRKPASYCFAQQKDSSCHVMPFMNLSILNNTRQQALEQKNEFSVQDQKQWYTKLNWLPQTFLWTRTWDEAIAKTEHTAFGEYQKKVLQEGVICGHAYDEKGYNFFQSRNPIQNHVRMTFMPYNFTDARILPEDLRYKHIGAAFKTLPLFWDNGKAKIYDPVKKEYVILKELTDKESIKKGNWDISTSAIEGTSSEQKAQQNMMLSQEAASLVRSDEQQREQGSWLETFYNASVNIISAGVWGITKTAESAYEAVSQLNAQIDPDTDYEHQSFQLQPGKGFLTSRKLYHFFKLTPEQKKFLNLPDHTHLNFPEYSVLGHEMVFKYRYLPEQSEMNSYYMSGLLQQMLFCMGVDNQNQPIDEQHPLSDANIGLKNEIQSSETNPWALPSFKKENVLEHQIANMIQRDPSLKQKMINTVDILFPSWYYYNQLDNLYDSKDPNNRKSLKEAKKYLLGEDLFLAYTYVANLRWLWAAATSRKAFNAVFELDPILANLMRLPGVPGPNQLMRNAQAKTKEGYSYLDVWEQIQINLIAKPDVPKELASFSGHGVVLSFYHDLIEEQKKNGLENPEVMKKLNFALIDSYYGEQLSPIYRDVNGKENEEACDLKKLTTPTENLLLSVGQPIPNKVKPGR